MKWTKNLISHCSVLIFVFVFVSLISLFPLYSASHAPLVTPSPSTQADQFIWTRYWWARWRYPTRLPSTRTHDRQCASIARGFYEGCSGRAYSAKVNTDTDSFFMSIVLQNWQFDQSNANTIRIYCVLFLSDCKFNCHKRCLYKVPNDCLGETIGGKGKYNLILSQLHVFVFIFLFYFL